MTAYTTRYYRIGRQPIAAIYAPAADTPLQAWYPDGESGTLKRMDSYIQDIAASDDVISIGTNEFQAFCDRAMIKNALPEASIRRSLLLAQFSARAAALDIHTKIPALHRLTLRPSLLP